VRRIRERRDISPKGNRPEGLGERGWPVGPINHRAPLRSIVGLQAAINEPYAQQRGVSERPDHLAGERLVEEAGAASFPGGGARE
jgi:hypothetical protein